MHCGDNEKRRSVKTTSVILIISLLLLLAGAVGGTMAYIRDAADPVTNTFIPAEVIIDINENVTATTKDDISFTNRDTEKAVPVYIRATLVIHWTDLIDLSNDGEDNPTMQIIPKPSGANVDIKSGLGENWLKKGDIYYYALPVEPGKKTEDMLKEAITVLVPEGSTAECHIEVHAEAIQAEPKQAVEAAWPDVKVDEGGKLTLNGGGA